MFLNEVPESAIFNKIAGFRHQGTSQKSSLKKTNKTIN